MRHFLTYMTGILIVFAAVSCARDLDDLEGKLEKDNTVTISATNSRMITRSGLEETEFEVGNRYLLYVRESAQTDWTSAVMYANEATEDRDHLINYGEDIFFEGRSLDFYGATVCSTDKTPENNSTTKSPVINLALDEEGKLADLMYSRNLLNCTSQQGLLQMHFTHALSKIQVEVSKQSENAEELKFAKIKSVTLTNTRSEGTLDIINGSWDFGGGNATDREFYKGEVSLTTTPGMLKDETGSDAEMLIFPNKDNGESIGVKIVYTLDEAGETPITATSVILKPGSTDEPFIFEQNYRYTLSLIISTDGVLVVTILPKVYDWIDEEPFNYLGQPVTFGNLMWMDRNLGALSADYENDWYNTIGHYFQFGRNIPYIMDVEKFKAYVNEGKGLPYTKPESDLFQKLYVMYYDSDNTYENISTNMILNECLYRFHDDDWGSSDAKNRHIKNMVECIYTYDHQGNRVHGIKLVKDSDTELIRFPDYLWGNHLTMSDEELRELYKFGYGGNDLLFPTLWTYKDTKGKEYWQQTQHDPCPKGWRLPTKEDLEVLMPTTQINWNEVDYPQKADIDTIRYGKTSDGNHVCYILKNKGKNNAYRLRIMSHYAAGSTNKRYFSISRYGASPDDENLSGYLNSDDDEILSTELESTKWANPIETINYPACGFIVPDSDMIDETTGQINWTGTMTTSARPDLRSFGYGTVLRTSDAYDLDEGGNTVNDYSYVQYLSTTDYQLSIQKLSRRSLGDQIRCVRDINAKD